jgi:hypothetical protein
LRLISSSGYFIGLLEIRMIPRKCVVSASAMWMAPAAARAQRNNAVVTAALHGANRAAEKEQAQPKYH